jgi:anti-sigma B factor antagonist
MAGEASMQQFAVDIAQVEPVVVVAVRGDLDSLTTGELESALEQVITTHEQHVVIDGREIGFVDSTGVSALVAAMRRLNRARRRLALVHGAGALQRALAVTGLDHSFETYPTLDEAIAALAAAPRIGRG